MRGAHQSMTWREPYTVEYTRLKTMPWSANMRVLQQPAYILHSRAWRETSLILECVTRDYGRIGLLARGAKRRKSRLGQALLQPLQQLQISFVQRGALGNLQQAERMAPFHGRLHGQTLLAGLYVNELVVRLTQRDDPNPDVFTAYERIVSALVQDASPAWSLRLFERDLLQALGYAMRLDHEAGSGKPLEPDADYHYFPEEGPVRARSTMQGLVLKGADLLALARAHRPDSHAQNRLRRLMRAQLRYHLDGKPLHAWQLLAAQPQNTTASCSSNP